MEDLIISQKITLTVFRSFFCNKIFKLNFNNRFGLFLFFVFELPSLKMFLIRSYFLPISASLFL